MNQPCRSFRRPHNAETLSSALLVSRAGMSTSCRLDMSGMGNIDTTIVSDNTQTTETLQSGLRRFPRELNNGFECAAAFIDIAIDVDKSGAMASSDDLSLSTSVSDGDIISDQPSDALKTSKMNRKTVRFSDVHLREYAACLGDNPSVTRGAPLSLDWEIKNELKYFIDAFEKSEHSAARLQVWDGGKCSKRSSLERLHVLKDLGYSREEIRAAADEAERVKAQRISTRRKYERSEKFRAAFNSFTCLFQFSDDISDSKIDESFRTVSTRCSSIDLSTSSTNGHEVQLDRSQNKNRNKVKLWSNWRQQRLKQALKRTHTNWEPPTLGGKGKQNTNDPLDTARHKKTHSLDLSTY